MARAALLVLLLSLLALPGLVAAQQAQPYTFDSGARFTIPAGAALRDGDVPLLNLDGAVLIEVVEPALFGGLAGTQNAALSDVLATLLDGVGFDGQVDADGVFRETLPDGRELLGYVFETDSGVTQSVLVLRMSDGSIGGLNVRSAQALNDAQIDRVLTLAASFDVATSSATPTPLGGRVIAPPVAATPTPATVVVQPTAAPATSRLPQQYRYPSGVSFAYPDGYVLVNEDDPPVGIGVENVVLITMVDPALVGMPPGETMASIARFAVEDTPVPATGFAPLDVGGREALIASAPDGDYIRSIALVRFADDTVGIMDILSFEPLSGDVLEDVRAIAASFDSASATVSAPTRAEIEQSRALFEEAMTAYDGDDFAAAQALLTEALDIDSEFGLAWYWRGAAHQHLGALEDALADYQQALALAPEERQVLRDIAEVQFLLDRVDDAVETITAYVDEPGEGGVDAGVTAMLDVIARVAEGEYVRDFYYNRANELQRIGLYDDALRDNQTVLDNEQDDWQALGQRGSILIDMDRHAEAIDALTGGIEVRRSPVLFYLRGLAYQGNFRADPGAIVDSVHDFQCAVLLADDTISDAQLAEAERGIRITLISSDDYAPITDAADCAA